MGNIIGHNTEEMRVWSDTMKKYSEDFDREIGSLFNLVRNFVGTEFTGGLADNFEESVLSKESRFASLSETLRECADLIEHTSVSIDEDEQRLVSNYENNSAL